MYIDSHAHLTGQELQKDVDALLLRAREAQVEIVVNICTDLDSLQRGLQIRKKNPLVFLAAATTPHDVEKEGESFFPEVQRAAQNGDLVAIGETGLDYYYEHSPKNLQKKFLSRYFSLADQWNLPIIFHCRDAFQDLFEMADAEYENKPAVLHCFTGTQEEARGVLDRGWYISFSGIVTFKKSESLREILKYVPEDRLLIETDSPYLSPQSKRGKANEPAFIVETAEMIAKVRGISLEQIAKSTRENAYKFFSFSKHTRIV
jgi:TatD DNase family protein